MAASHPECQAGRYLVLDAGQRPPGMAPGRGKPRSWLRQARRLRGGRLEARLGQNRARRGCATPEPLLRELPRGVGRVATALPAGPLRVASVRGRYAGVRRDAWGAGHLRVLDGASL